MAEKLKFKTEEERQKALMGLESEPPTGTTNVSKWQEELEAREQAIMDADVGDSDAGSDAPPQPPPEQPPVQESQPSTDTEPSQPEESQQKEMFFGKYTRDQLPEALRGYKTEEQMVEQLAHARKYANDAEVELVNNKREIAELRKKLDEQAKLGDRIASLEKEKSDLVEKTNRIPMGPQQSTKSKEKLQRLMAKIDSLKKLAEDESDPMAKELYPILLETANSFETTMAELDANKSEFAKYREESKKQVDDLRNEFKTTQESIVSQRKAEDEKLQRERRIKMLGDFQSSKPELATTKPLTAVDGADSVEASIWKFCQKLAGGNIQDWAMANRVVNAYLRGDPEVLDICKTKGIYPDSVGIKDSDVENYAILTRVDALMKGFDLDPMTGQWKEHTNLFGEQAKLPDPEAAYNYLLDKKGIRKRETEQQIADAEKRGQQAVADALMRRDRGPKTLGDAGTSTPQDSGKELSKEQATAIFNDEKYSEQMEVLCRQGSPKGWNMFTMYNKALRTLDLPEEEPDKHWIRPKAVPA